MKQTPLEVDELETLLEVGACYEIDGENKVLREVWQSDDKSSPHIFRSPSPLPPAHFKNSRFFARVFGARVFEAFSSTMTRARFLCKTTDSVCYCAWYLTTTARG